MGQLTISMAMFNGFLYVYQRVNTMEGSGWFSFVRGWTETWLKHWNHQWIHGSLLRYPYHINYIYTIYYTDIICPFRMTHFHSFPSFVTKTPPERDTTRPEGDSSHVPTHPKRTYNSPGGTKSVFSDRPGRTISSVGYSQVYVGGWGMVNPSFLLVKKVFMKK